MAIIINGKKLAEKIKDQVVGDIIKLNQGINAAADVRPNLAIILIGEREESQLYVDLKEKESKKVGIDTHVYKCPSDIEERAVFEMIDCLNKDELIDAILVQLPLPSGFDTDGIIRAIDPGKDVDRFHPDNLEVLLKTCNHAHVMPPLFSVVLKMLESINYEIKDKLVCIIANSGVFSRSLARVLECQGAKAQTAVADETDLAKKTSQADVLIAAVGRVKFIKKEMIKKDAVVIDIGMNKQGKKVYGDVDFVDCQDKAGAITPVPGGVGPMTIAMLFKNTVELYKNRHKK